ncbi:hypothetical protein ACEPPN_016288 [Leptodophora sp. 'Broadleaf-Isolate-01']
MAQQTPPATKGPENASALSQRLLDMVFNTPRQHRVPPNPQTHCSQGKKTWGSVDPSGPGADTKPWPNPTPPPTLPPSNPHTCKGRTVESTSLGRGIYSVRDGRAVGIGWTLALKRMPTNLFCTIRMRGRHPAEHF